MWSVLPFQLSVDYTLGANIIPAHHFPDEGSWSVLDANVAVSPAKTSASTWRIRYDAYVFMNNQANYNLASGTTTIQFNLPAAGLTSGHGSGAATFSITGAVTAYVTYPYRATVAGSEVQVVIYWLNPPSVGISVQLFPMYISFLGSDGSNGDPARPVTVPA